MQKFKKCFSLDIILIILTIGSRMNKIEKMIRTTNVTFNENMLYNDKFKVESSVKNKRWRLEWLNWWGFKEFSS